jgi:hypothetical protein
MMPMVFWASLPPWPRLYAVDPGWRRLAEDPQVGEHQQEAEHHAEQRRQHDEQDRLLQAARVQHAEAGLGHAGPGEAADQGVRGGGRQPEPPRGEVPGDCPDQAGEDDRLADHAGVDGLADGVGDPGMEDEEGDEVEGRCPHHRDPRGEHAGRHHGGDRVGGIVEAVGEVEHERQQDDGDDRDERQVRHT